jgi:transcriptional regulator with XRE-family HTH domain
MTHPIDAHVGKRIRHLRWRLGITQMLLASRIGVKFQQVQKYETGANRISASRLWEVSKALDVPISYFFEDHAMTERSKATASDNSHPA